MSTLSYTLVLVTEAIFLSLLHLTVYLIESISRHHRFLALVHIHLNCTSDDSTLYVVGIVVWINFEDATDENKIKVQNYVILERKQTYWSTPLSVSNCIIATTLFIFISTYFFFFLFISFCSLRSNRDRFGLEQLLLTTMDRAEKAERISLIIIRLM
jgi:hypothetical protein